MSKHKKFSKWYYDDEEDCYHEVNTDKHKRLIEKRMKTALKSRNVDRLLELEDDN